MAKGQVLVEFDDNGFIDPRVPFGTAVLQAICDNFEHAFNRGLLVVELKFGDGQEEESRLTPGDVVARGGLTYAAEVKVRTSEKYVLRMRPAD